MTSATLRLFVRHINNTMHTMQSAQSKPLLFNSDIADGVPVNQPNALFYEQNINHIC